MCLRPIAQTRHTQCVSPHLASSCWPSRFKAYRTLLQSQQEPTETTQSDGSSHPAVRIGQGTLHDSRTTAACRSTCALLTCCCAVCVFVCSCCKEQTGLPHTQRLVMRLGSCLSGYSAAAALFSVGLHRRSQPTDLTAPFVKVFQIRTQLFTTGTDIITRSSDKQCFQLSDPLPRHFQRFAGPSTEVFGHVD